VVIYSIAEIDRFQGLHVRCICGILPIEYNELRRLAPFKLQAEPLNAKEKKLY
jgi:hypothetical protein